MYEEKCNCGRPVRYMTDKGEKSCNKYARCPTYQDLEQSNAEIAEDFGKILKAANDLSMFREGTSHYMEAVNTITRLKRKWNPYV